MNTLNKKSFFIVSAIIVFLISIISFLIFNNLTKNSIKPNNSVSEDKYMILKYTISESLKVEELFVFDSNSVCTNTRIIHESLNDESKNQLENTYEMILLGIEIFEKNNLQQLNSNVELNDNILKFNSNEFNGRTQNDILETNISLADEIQIEIIHF